MKSQVCNIDRLVAGDRGDAGALARVRIPTLDEEDAKRLMRHRERLVRTRCDRLRCASAASADPVRDTAAGGDPRGDGLSAGPAGRHWRATGRHRGRQGRTGDTDDPSRWDAVHGGHPRATRGHRGQ